MLQPSDGPLCETYDLALLDLDGVVYIGPDAVPGAPVHLTEAARSGMHLAYVTNNASRPPGVVARHLRELGLTVADHDVVTSAQAAARVLAESLPRGAKVFVIGGTGLFEALTDLGLEPVQDIDADPDAVVSGYHPDLLWKIVIDGAILVRRGLPWVASNTDLTVPTPHGRGPGNGVLVEAVARYAGRQPVVAGKPQPPLFEETLRRCGGSHPLVVGDRLDTDIAGAANTGFDSLLVMTGVCGLAELVAAAPGQRPTYISADLAGLRSAHPVPELDGAGGTLDGSTARVEGGALQVTGAPGPDDWWRLVAAVAWQHLDRTGQPVDVSALSAPGSVAR
jgi:glycerol-1-phosphatase